MPSLIPAAIIGSSALGAGASIVSSNNQANAATSAAQTQANAANQAAQIQQQEFNTTTANEAPYLQAGNTSLNALMTQLGLGPGGTGTGPLTQSFTPYQAPAPFNFNPQNLQNTPGYQFQLQQGEQAITDQASAVGGVGGGNTLKALTTFGQGLAGTEYQNAYTNALNAYNTNSANSYQAWLANQQGQQNVQQTNFGNLQTLAGSGQNAAAKLGALGASAASSIGDDITSGAAATAAGTVGAASANASGLSGVTNSLSGLSSNYLLQSLLSGGGASSDPYLGGGTAYLGGPASSAAGFNSLVGL